MTQSWHNPMITVGNVLLNKARIAHVSKKYFLFCWHEQTMKQRRTKNSIKPQGSPSAWRTKKCCCCVSWWHNNHTTSGTTRPIPRMHHSIPLSSSIRVVYDKGRCVAFHCIIQENLRSQNCSTADKTMLLLPCVALTTHPLPFYMQSSR